MRRSHSDPEIEAYIRKAERDLAAAPAACISVFAGRIADTGVDPIPIMAEAVQFLGSYPNIELIWASPRELLNIFHAESTGCHIYQRRAQKTSADRQGSR